MDDAPQIAYRLRADSTPEAERAALGNVFAFVLQKRQKQQEDGPETVPDARKEFTNGSGKVIMPQRP